VESSNNYNITAHTVPTQRKNQRKAVIIFPIFCKGFFGCEKLETNQIMLSLSIGASSRMLAMRGNTSLTSNEWSDDGESKGSSFRISGPSINVDDANGEVSRPFVTSTLAPEPRRRNDISDFTIDKLNFGALGLHGRQTEIKLLKATVSKMMTSAGGSHNEQARQLILISGYSGTGKTALANHALKRSTERLGGLYVRGKFDSHLRNQPYSGISAACAEICSAILDLQLRNPSRSEELCRKITLELDSELALLIQVIPMLAEIVALQDASISGGGDSPPVRKESSSADSKIQLKFAFLRFIRAVSCQFMPLVFVLDDLQWADVCAFAE
jgi:hypothetical protein